MVAYSLYFLRVVSFRGETDVMLAYRLLWAIVSLRGRSADFWRLLDQDHVQARDAESHACKTPSMYILTRYPTCSSGLLILLNTLDAWGAFQLWTETRKSLPSSRLAMKDVRMGT